MKMVYWHR